MLAITTKAITTPTLSQIPPKMSPRKERAKRLLSRWLDIWYDWWDRTFNIKVFVITHTDSQISTDLIETAWSKCGHWVLLA